MDVDNTARGRTDLVRDVAQMLLSSEGDLPIDLRAAAFAHASAASGRPVPNTSPLSEPLARLVEKVTTEAYRIVDADIDAVRAAGYSDDAILEAVLATAAGAGLSRLEIGLDAIGWTA